jgi:hypothetical protein
MLEVDLQWLVSLGIGLVLERSKRGEEIAVKTVCENCRGGSGSTAVVG